MNHYFSDALHRSWRHKHNFNFTFSAILALSSTTTLAFHTPALAVAHSILSLSLSTPANAQIRCYSNVAFALARSPDFYSASGFGIYE